MLASGCSNQVTKYVSSLTVAADTGVITVAANGTNVGTTGDFVLTPNAVSGGQLDWTCTGSSISKKFLPANCR
jgi:type IV pilus assembly protein PilA